MASASRVRRLSMKERPAVPAPMTRYVACVVEVSSPPWIGLAFCSEFVHMICCC